jgi:hypothetical protein
MTTPYPIVPTVFLLNFASNGMSSVTDTQANLQKYLASYLSGGPDPSGQPYAGFFAQMNPYLQGGDWSVTWGPCVYSLDPTKLGNATNAMYVAYSPSLSTYVVAIAATNPTSIDDWIAEDGDVAPDYMQSWPFTAPFVRTQHTPCTSAPAAISAATAQGVSDLLTQPAMKDPHTGKSIQDYLNAVDGSGQTLIFTGHSLAGALSPTLAFHLFPNGTTAPWSEILTLPTAGATPGNQAFATAFITAFPPVDVATGFGWNTDYGSTHDVVPHAWNQLSGVVTGPTLDGQFNSFWGVMSTAIGAEMVTALAGAETLSGGVYVNLSQQFLEPDWGEWQWVQNTDGTWQYPPAWTELDPYWQGSPLNSEAEMGGMIMVTHVDQYPNIFGVLPPPRMSHATGIVGRAKKTGA